MSVIPLYRRTTQAERDANFAIARKLDEQAERDRAFMRRFRAMHHGWTPGGAA